MKATCDAVDDGVVYERFEERVDGGGGVRVGRVKVGKAGVESSILEESALEGSMGRVNIGRVHIGGVEVRHLEKLFLSVAERHVRGQDFWRSESCCRERKGPKVLY